MSEYSRPLLELISSLSSHEKVVLVGHSLGGLSLGPAMEKFPHKIFVAVFLTAFLPDTIHHQPSYVIDQDLELAKTLIIRPGSLFQEDLAKEKKFSDKAYGSVPIVYAICDEDKAISIEFQRWMIENRGVTDVVEIHGADHIYGNVFKTTRSLRLFNRDRA